MDERTRNLIAECKRQEESCLYTSTTFFEWLKAMRFWRTLLVVVPIILGGLSTWPLLAKQPDLAWISAVCALLAGMIPAIHKALDYDVSLEMLAKSAHQYKVLQDRFRQAWRVTALGSFDDFKAEFDKWMAAMDEARTGSLTAPERFFKRAHKKINSGHYDFTVDGAAGQPPQRQRDSGARPST